MAERLDSHRTSVILAVIFVILTLFTVWQIWGIQRDLEREQLRSDMLAEKQQNTEEVAGLLEQQIRDLGERPVVNPKDLETVRGDRGPQGPGPTQTQVVLAVAEYCGDGRCDGQNPTATQVANAVALFCSNRNDCRGPQGAAGEDGQNASPEMVAAAVADFCAARDGCRGPQGEQGPPGPAGADEPDDPDPDDPEIQDEEIQDPEVDDPDPASPFSFTFTVPGNGLGQSDSTYTVTCANEGTDEEPRYACSVTEKEA